MNEFLSFLCGLTMQVLFFLSLSYAAYAICQRWFSGSSVGVRCCAACIIFCWMLSILFAVLVSLGMFAPLPAIMFALVVFAIISRGRLKPIACIRSLADDLTVFREFAPRMGGHTEEPGGASDPAAASTPQHVMRPLSGQNNPTGRGLLIDRCLWWGAMGCFLLLAVLLTVRTLALPLLGWDTLTYHGVKAGMWVQTGGRSPLIAPGGWEGYLTFFGGGEAFTAWAMLFLHGDLLAGIPDLFFWALVGLATVCLAREFGMPARTATLLGLAFMCTVDLSRLVGSGYVDTCGNAFFLGGILFLVRFARAKQHADFCLTFAALGLSSSVKFNMLAAGVLMSLLALALLLRSGRPPLAWLLGCLLAFAAPVAPWLLFNYMATGYPLGCIPLSIGPLHLGAAPPNLAWALGPSGRPSYTFVTEAKALCEALGLYGFTLCLIVLGLPGIALRVRQGRGKYVLALLAIASIMALYFAPSFTPVRLGWPRVNGRFLAPAVILMAVAGLPLLKEFRCGLLLVEEVSAVAVVYGTWSFLRTFVNGQHSVESVFLAAAIALVALGCGLVHYRRRLALPARPAAVVALSLVAFLGGMYGLAQLKNWFRIDAYENCITMHRVPCYWVDGLRALQSDRRPLRIAFAYGATNASHHSFIAPFLGPSLNNRLLYVPPSADGSFIPHGPDYATNARLSFESWTNALRKAGVTHVLCLQPPCAELKWMEAHPSLFVALIPRNGQWGLFRIEWSREPPG
jgi:hypothetical protein